MRLQIYILSYFFNFLFFFLRIFFSHGIYGIHGNLSLRDGFISHRLHRLHGFSFFDSLFCFAKIALRICTDFIATRFLLDILEELGRCAALDFAVRCFSFGVFSLTEFTERTEFFGLSAERTYEPCVPTIRDVVV